MWRMGLYDQFKKAFQDIVAPEIYALRGEIQRVDGKITGLEGKMDGLDGRLTAKIDGVDAKVSSLRSELLAEIRRLDARFDGVDRELRTAIEIRERLAALEARQRPSRYASTNGTLARPATVRSCSIRSSGIGTPASSRSRRVIISGSPATITG